MANAADDDVRVSRKQLTCFMLLTFLTVLLVSGGVGWFVSGLAFDHANAENEKTVNLVRMQGRDGLRSLYLSEKARCAASTATRDVLTDNARQQQRWYAYLSRTHWMESAFLAHLPRVVVPPPIPACKVAVPDPTGKHAVHSLPHGH